MQSEHLAEVKVVTIPNYAIGLMKIRRAPKHDTVDFKPIMERASNIMSLSIVVADKGYDSEDGEANHEFV